MKKVLMVVAVMLTLSLSVITTSQAIEMPDMSAGGAILVPLDGRPISMGERAAVKLFGVGDIINVNAAFVLPNKEIIKADYVAGFDVTLNIVALVSKSKYITVTPGINLEAGLGLLGDVAHINGLSLKDIRKVTYPATIFGFKF